MQGVPTNDGKFHRTYNVYFFGHFSEIYFCLFLKWKRLCSTTTKIDFEPTAIVAVLKLSTIIAHDSC